LLSLPVGGSGCFRILGLCLGLFFHFVLRDRLCLFRLFSRFFVFGLFLFVILIVGAEGFENRAQEVGGIRNVIRLFDFDADMGMVVTVLLGKQLVKIILEWGLPVLVLVEFLSLFRFFKIVIIFGAHLIRRFCGFHNILLGL
jgi:hypothetical protein